MERFYLAYGSNLNFRQMKSRCPMARLIGTTEIPNYELLFKGSKTGAYLTIEKKDGGRVPAGVWATDEKDELALDRYEGFPFFYYKTEMELPVKFSENGKVKNLPVYVYIMHEDRELGIPSPTYVNTCIEGCRDFGLPDDILWDAVKKAWGLDYENE